MNRYGSMLLTIDDLAKYLKYNQIKQIIEKELSRKYLKYVKHDQSDQQIDDANQICRFDPRINKKQFE